MFLQLLILIMVGINRPTREPALNMGSTRIEPKPDEKPAVWVFVEVDGLQLGLGLTRARFFF